MEGAAQLAARLVIGPQPRQIDMRVAGQRDLARAADRAPATPLQPRPQRGLPPPRRCRAAPRRGPADRRRPAAAARPSASAASARCARRNRRVSEGQSSARSAASPASSRCGDRLVAAQRRRRLDDLRQQQRCSAATWRIDPEQFRARQRRRRTGWPNGARADALRLDGATRGREAEIPRGWGRARNSRAPSA